MRTFPHIGVVLALALCGCETPGKYEAAKTWVRVDGAPLTNQLLADGAKCNAIADQDARPTLDTQRFQIAYHSCMAQFGYVER